MTPLAPEDFRLLQASGLVTMALVIGARLVPPLQRAARPIWIAALAFYAAAAIAIVIRRQF